MPFLFSLLVMVIVLGLIIGSLRYFHFRHHSSNIGSCHRHRGVSDSICWEYCLEDSHLFRCLGGIARWAILRFAYISEANVRL